MSGHFRHLAVPSCEAVTQRLPFGVIATSTTQPLWPARLAVQRPVNTSHTRAVKSSPAVIARRPSGVKATAHTPAQCSSLLTTILEHWKILEHGKPVILLLQWMYPHLSHPQLSCINAYIMPKQGMLASSGCRLEWKNSAETWGPLWVLSKYRTQYRAPAKKVYQRSAKYAFPMPIH